MKTVGRIAMVVVCVSFGTCAPVAAEHMTLIEPSGALRPADEAARPESRTLDMDLKVGGRGFRLGGRLFGPDGVAGAWLNGEVGANGFTLDGRVQKDNGRAYNFKLEAEALDGLTRAMWQWFLPSPLK